MTDSTTHLADLLSTTDEIEITTARGDGSPRAWVPIWFVALDEHVSSAPTEAPTAPGTDTPPHPVTPPSAPAPAPTRSASSRSAKPTS
ncbi:MAG TPA: hypothetical protein VIY28_16890 [Pseudonocardiaceae bacterium]